MDVHVPPSRELHPNRRARGSVECAPSRGGILSFFCKSLVTLTYFRLYFHAAELPAKGLLGSDGYRTGDTDAFSFPVGVGGSGDRFAALPWYLRSAAARASAFDVPPFLLEVER